MRVFRSTALLLALTLAAAAPGFAAQPRGAAPAARPTSALASLRGFLVSLWNDAGCLIDPLGRCLTRTAADEGCLMDPLGRCAPSTASARPTAHEGCRLDPFGGCIKPVQPTADAGCLMDPFGRCLHP
jgi:hypothetical protein